MEIGSILNGERITADVPDHRLLCDFLREDLGLSGTKVSCGEGVCGSCNVLLDGEVVRSCLLLAAQADGRELVTVEGLARGTELGELQRAFIEAGAVQCGYCTPGILITATALLDEEPQPDDATILEALAGNLCRCSGYGKIVQAIKAVSVGRVN